MSNWTTRQDIGQHMSGLPGTNPSTLTSQIFWHGVVTIGAIFKRLVRPYRRPPLCLASLVDPSVLDACKQSLASYFMHMPDCCLDAAFTGPLRRAVNSVEDLLAPNGCGMRILEAAFCSKNHNIQVENNFARASSWQQTNPGRHDRTFNFIAKHLLAEVKHNHKQGRAQKHQPKHVISEGNNDGSHDEPRPIQGAMFSWEWGLCY